MDPNGFLLDIGAGDLQINDPDRRTWSGQLTVSKGSCLDGKSLTSMVETSDGTRSLAQVSPGRGSERGRFITLNVKGLGTAPF